MVWLVPALGLVAVRRELRERDKTDGDAEHDPLALTVRVFLQLAVPPAAERAKAEP
jgi:hypothetical protein